MTDLAQACLDEIRDLHAFFEAWMGGHDLPDRSFARVEAALAPDFLLISPDGSRADRAAVLAALRPARGSRADVEDPFRLWIENPEARRTSRTSCLCVYEEWQSIGGRVTARYSSALFDRQGIRAPVRWRHLHETWMPGDTVPVDAGDWPPRRAAGAKAELALATGR